MWKCKHCGEESGDAFDSCRKCGWDVEGHPPNPSDEQKQPVVSAKPNKPTFEIPKWLVNVIVLGFILAFAILKTNRDLADKEETSAPIPQDGSPFVVSEKRLKELRHALVRAGFDDGTTGEGFHLSIIERRKGGKYLVKIEWLEREKPPKDLKLEALQIAFQRTNEMRRATLSLCAAVIGGDLRSVSNIIKEAKADLNGDPHLFVTRQPPLLMAVSRTNLAIAALLVTKGADVNAKNEKGMTALHLAAKDGSSKIVEMLLANYADKEIRDATGKTALDYATAAAQNDIINLLTASSLK